MDLTTPLRAGLPPRNAPLEDESGCLSVTGGARRERLAAGPPRRLAMARNARTTRSASDRANLYQQITERIIAQLEEGRVPWVQPWGTATASIGMPYNAVSDRRYSGINILTLWNAIVTRCFATHAFLPFQPGRTACRERGG